jgi:hypothetical protein
MRIRLYPESGAAEPAREGAVATLVIGPRREGAILPGLVEPAAQFFLEAVESDDPAQRARLVSLLTRDTVPVHRASSSGTRGPVRTRGDYTAQEPYGTPGYWRAVIGRLPAQVGLRLDADDYNQALREMEAPVPITEPKIQPAVIPHEPEPETAPARGRPFDIQAALQELQLLLGGSLGLVRGATRSAVPPKAVAPGAFLADLLQQMRDDTEFLQAVAHLQEARSHPSFRSVILPALEKFARESKGQE